MLVSLSRTGNRDAFAELVARRQTWIRNLMRRCSGDVALAVTGDAGSGRVTLGFRPEDAEAVASGAGRFDI